MEAVEKVTYLFEALHPNRLEQCFMVHTPKHFTSLYKVLRKRFRKDTDSRIHIIETKKFDSMLYHIDAEEMDKRYGGKASYTKPPPWWDEAMVPDGARPPPPMRPRVPVSSVRNARPDGGGNPAASANGSAGSSSATTNRTKNSSRAKSSINVPAGKNYAMDIPVSEGSFLHHKFEVQSGEDVGFNAFYTSVDGSLESLLFSSRGGHSNGRFEVPRSGTVKYVFDNSGSHHSSKLNLSFMKDTSNDTSNDKPSTHPISI